jgi:hypothetical protein
MKITDEIQDSSFSNGYFHISVFTGNTKETEVKICALNGEKIQKEVLEVLPDNNPQVSGQL